MMQNDAALQIKYATLSKFLDERGYRLCLAADAIAFGRGGVSRVSRASGVSRSTIYQGIRDLKSEPKPLSACHAMPNTRIRREGGGRKPYSERDETLLPDLDALLDPVSSGDAISPLRWTCKSTGALAAELRAKGHTVSQATVWRLIDELGYGVQSNRRTRIGIDHADRNTQFMFINFSAQEFLNQQLPVISVDTKMKEGIGPHRNASRDWQRQGKVMGVAMHDVPDAALGAVTPYGVNGIGRNDGWVSAGVTRDTAQFAVESIRRWWYQLGRSAYPDARKILITAECDGSNELLSRVWKAELQRLADELGMELHVRHFPPGTSKWNGLEHRMVFCHITDDWRGRRLTNRMAVVELIAVTRAAQEVMLRADLDENTYEMGITISDDVMNSLAIKECEFLGEWNYSIVPRGNAEV